MIYIAIGSNLPSEAFGTPAGNCRAAIAFLGEAGLNATAISPFYETAPVPASDQPWFVNCVIAVAHTGLTPQEALRACLGVEARMGRVRTVRNAARIVDIDLIAWHDQVIDEPPELIVPHPRLGERAFVLRPLADLAPDWVHPRTGRGIADLVATLPLGQPIRRMPEPG